MSYVCNICQAKVPPGVIQRRHTIKGDQGQIKGEIPVCQDCEVSLKAGHTVEQMIQIKRIEAKQDQEPSDLVKKVLSAFKRPVKGSPKLVAPPPMRPATFRRRTSQ